MVGWLIVITAMVVFSTFVSWKLVKVAREDYKYYVKVLKKETGNSISFKNNMDKVELPVIPVKINNKEYHFILDSGANSNYLDENLAKELELPFKDGGSFYGIEGKTKPTKLTEVAFNCDNNAFEESFLVTNLSPAFTQATEGTDIVIVGILGNQFFAKNRWQLDFENLVVWIH